MTHWKTLALVAAVLVVAGGVFLLRTFDPNLAGNPFPKCSFQALTGFFCAGCGLTRAAHALAHGDIARAVSMNPFVMFCAPILGLIILDQVRTLPAFFQTLLRPFRGPWFWVGGTAAFWLLRNLPWYPFTLLAPG